MNTSNQQPPFETNISQTTKQQLINANEKRRE